MRFGRQGSPAVFGLVLGLLIGIFAAMLLIPQRSVDINAVGRSVDSATGTGGELASEDPDADAASGAVASGNGAAESSGVRGVGSSATGGTRGGSVAGAGTGSSGAAAIRPNARGVTDDNVKVGIAVVDLGPIKALGPNFDNGDPEEQFRSVMETWKREGAFPVHGRKVEFVFRRYSALSVAEERAACASLVQDEKVFMVIGQLFFYAGSECVAREFQTPLLTSDGPFDEVFARSHPFLFSIQMSNSRLLRNWVHWADRRGALRAKKIGLYYPSDAVSTDVVNKTIKAELSRLGYPAPTEATTDQPRGGPGDALAVQKFRAAGVDLAMLLTSRSGFMQQAEAQGYKPTYVESDHEFGTSDTNASLYPASQFDGSFGMTGRRVGESRSGIPLSPEGRACLANFERHTGKKPAAESTEWSYVLTACDEAKILLLAVRAAGRNLTHQSFVAALETLRDVPMSRFADVTFTSNKHHGGDYQRTVQWQRGCTCWKAIGAFDPLFVP